MTGAPLPDDVLHHGFLIVGHGFTLDDADRSFGTGADAGAKTVTEEIGYKPGFPVNDLERSLPGSPGCTDHIPVHLSSSIPIIFRFI